MSHLLIVEDDELLRDALAAQLLQGGHTVASAAHGVAALSQLESTRFDGVILDLGLPLQAMLRRSQLPAFGGSAELVAVGKQKLRIDAKLPRAWLDEMPVDLTQREWELLSLLVTQIGLVVSREDVLHAWKDDTGEASTANANSLGSNALEVYVHRLRRKLVDSGLSIRNVRGLGYMLEPLKA